MLQFEKCKMYDIIELHEQGCLEREVCRFLDASIEQDTIKVTHDGEIVGVFSRSIQEDIYWIDDFGVVKDKRRKGYGQAIVQGIVKECIRKGCREIHLYPGSEVARMFWESCGFVENVDIYDNTIKYIWEVR